MYFNITNRICNSKAYRDEMCFMLQKTDEVTGLYRKNWCYYCRFRHQIRYISDIIIIILADRMIEQFEID